MVRLMQNGAAVLAAAMMCQFWGIGGPAARAADAADQGAATQGQQTIAKGLDYLKAQQKPNSTWENPNDPPGITALVLKAFVQDPAYGLNAPFVQKGFKALIADQQPDGSIGESLTNYNTAIAISAMALSHDPAYKDQIDKAIAYLRRLQWDDRIEGIKPDMKVGPSNVNYGGFGYGGGKAGRADLSNTQTALDALHDAGLKADDPAFQAALKFVSRCQNNSETNDQKWAGDDGGFIYVSANGGKSAAGSYDGPDGRKMMRSYGAMTYAGLKSMMFAGLTKDDPRVKAAWNWVTHNWTLDINPGMGESNSQAAENGLFYYYHTLARALHAYGQPIITDSKGVKHDWRVELIDKLHSTQEKDGSWVGKQRWMESRPVLSTAFGVLALEEAQADLKEHPAK